MVEWTMRGTDFPFMGVQLNEGSPKDHVERFLEERPSSNWVLLGAHAVMSEEQLWTAWIQASRNALRGRMVARSIDAEFLRYLAGTHHISEAFSRAGVQEGQDNGWVVCLPAAKGHENDLGHLQPEAEDTPDFESALSDLLERLGWSESSRDTSFSIEAAKQLGIDAAGWSKARQTESIIAHILMADDQSSSHR
jgi:tRNA threonylcarbamoyladenosine modification (KEOPS) complex Cgi121 subunit